MVIGLGQVARGGPVLLAVQVPSLLSGPLRKRSQRI